MITVSITNARHIAAATAAYIATIPADPEATPLYADVTAYVRSNTGGSFVYLMYDSTDAEWVAWQQGGTWTTALT